MPEPDPVDEYSLFDSDNYDDYTDIAPPGHSVLHSPTGLSGDHIEYAQYREVLPADGKRRKRHQLVTGYVKSY